MKPPESETCQVVCPNRIQGGLTIEDPQPELGILKLDPTAERCAVCGGYHYAEKSIFTGRRQ